jgi:hypothetical protein
MFLLFIALVDTRLNLSTQERERTKNEILFFIDGRKVKVICRPDVEQQWEGEENSELDMKCKAFHQRLCVHADYGCLNADEYAQTIQTGTVSMDYSLNIPLLVWRHMIGSWLDLCIFHS